ncbi:MAG: NAD-dependent epimerase/dehydratase family protein, partial [Pseudomonadota bacterium]
MTTTTTRCLLLGSSGFLGRHIRSSLERRGLSCTGAQRSASAQDVAYGFPNDDLAQTLAGQTFDCVIVAARFAGAKEVSELTLEAFEEKMGTLCRS